MSACSINFRISVTLHFARTCDRLQADPQHYRSHCPILAWLFLQRVCNIFTLSAVPWRFHEPSAFDGFLRAVTKCPTLTHAPRVHSFGSVCSGIAFRAHEGPLWQRSLSLAQSVACALPAVPSAPSGGSAHGPALSSASEGPPKGSTAARCAFCAQNSGGNRAPSMLPQTESPVLECIVVPPLL